MTRTACLTLGICLLISARVIAQDTPTTPTMRLESAKLGTTINVHSFGTTLLCGQPSAEDFALAKQQGITTVINLRMPNEIKWDQPAKLNELGIHYHSIPFRSPNSLTDKIFDQTIQLLAKSKQTPTILHCASANRVGAIWMAHRVLNDKLDVDAAIREAKEVGLRTPQFQTKALDYIRRKQTP